MCGSGPRGHPHRSLRVLGLGRKGPEEAGPGWVPGQVRSAALSPSARLGHCLHLGTLGVVCPLLSHWPRSPTGWDGLFCRAGSKPGPSVFEASASCRTAQFPLSSRVQQLAVVSLAKSGTRLLPLPACRVASGGDAAWRWSAGPRAMALSPSSERKTNTRLVLWRHSAGGWLWTKGQAPSWLLPSRLRPSSRGAGSPSCRFRAKMLLL